MGTMRAGANYDGQGPSIGVLSMPSMPHRAARDTPRGGDREVVLAAVSRDGRNLQFASPRLKDDFQVVLRAVSKCGTALKYASNNLKNNREIVLAAVQQDPGSLRFASSDLASELLKDEEFVYWRMMGCLIAKVTLMSGQECVLVLQDMAGARATDVEHTIKHELATKLDLEVGQLANAQLLRGTTMLSLAGVSLLIGMHSPTNGRVIELQLVL
mmetsp:Transcript_52237/g.122248  ORF Transcript_52237/g.122248 Transcript_52237/m.122248 type:complete len:214 (-) Transcript_52237:20-661(-)